MPGVVCRENVLLRIRRPEPVVSFQEQPAQTSDLGNRCPMRGSREKVNVTENAVSGGRDKFFVTTHSHKRFLGKRIRK
jgi:hypothetical protein